MTAGESELRVPGARLFFRVRGHGPWLLVLQAGHGDADASRALAERLEDAYSVVSYDRRGQSRSPIEVGAGAPDLAVHTDDARRLLAALTSEPACIFGGSMGALIGLSLAVHCPERVRILVAHEPPLPALLPEPERQAAVRSQEEAEETYRRQGEAAALRTFATFTAFDPLDREDEQDPPAPSSPAPSAAEQRSRTMANAGFFLAHDAAAVRLYRLDLAALRAAQTRIVLARGAASAGAWPHRCAGALAAVLGTDVTEFPGGHNGYAARPRGFAERLRAVLAAP
jgi:pimeloyl-ACP methyl ester carboxylesterase